MTAFALFRYWDSDVRPPAVSALKAMTREQLHWQPAGWHSSAWDLAAHMCGAEWGWIYRNVLQKEPWGTRWNASRFATLDDLLAYWQHVHAVTVQWLEDTPAGDLDRRYPMPYADFKEASLHWIVHHVMEHEAHHRGQIFLLMRLQGLTPPET